MDPSDAGQGVPLQSTLPGVPLPDDELLELLLDDELGSPLLDELLELLPAGDPPLPELLLLPEAGWPFEDELEDTFAPPDPEGSSGVCPTVGASYEQAPRPMMIPSVAKPHA